MIARPHLLSIIIIIIITVIIFIIIIVVVIIMRPHLSGAEDSDLILGYRALEFIQCIWEADDGDDDDDDEDDYDDDDDDDGDDDADDDDEDEDGADDNQERFTQFSKLVWAAFIIHRLNFRDLEASNC